MVAEQEIRGRKTEYTLPEILRREAQARHRLDFEQQLLDGSLVSHSDVSQFTSECNIDPDTRDRYHALFDNFDHAVKVTDAAEISIREILFVEWEEDNTEFPEEWGLRFFEHWVGTLPNDVVIFRRLPNYFQVLCESKQDYTELMSALNPDEDTSTNTGMMHKRRLVHLDGIKGRINLMTVFGKENDTLTDQIEIHEQQHAMNDLEIDAFTEIETKAFAGKKLYVDQKDRAFVIKQFVTLKDELLARYREGQHADDIKDAVLDYQLFNNLEDVSGQLFVASTKLLDRIMKEFASLQPLLVTNTNLGVLVYQLTDIPLLDFPKYLRAYRGYLEQSVGDASAAAK